MLVKNQRLRCILPFLATVALPLQAVEFRSLTNEELLGDQSFFLLSGVNDISGDGSAITVRTSVRPGVILDCGSRFGCGSGTFVLSLDNNERYPFANALTSDFDSVRGFVRSVAALSFDGESAVAVSEVFRASLEAGIHRNGGARLLRETVSPDDSWLLAADASSDLSVVVGSVGPQAFIWTDSDGLEPLTGLPEDSNQGPAAISRDGRVVALNNRPQGLDALERAFESDQLAFRVVVTDSNAPPIPALQLTNALRWTAEKGPSELLPLSGFDYSSVSDLSGDGSVIVGTSNFNREFITDDLDDPKATVWIGGDAEELAAIDGFGSPRAIAVSSNGRVIAGSLFDNALPPSHGLNLPQHEGPNEAPRLPFSLGRIVDDGQRAALWFDNEPVLLEDLLGDLGLADQFEGWVLTEATAISDDGLTVAGNAIGPDGFRALFVAVLSVPEPAAATLVIVAWLVLPGVRRRATIAG